MIADCQFNDCQLPIADCQFSIPNSDFTNRKLQLQIALRKLAIGNRQLAIAIWQ